MEIPKRKILSGKDVFIISLIVIGLTVLGVWLWGLRIDRSLIENSLISVSILSISFFLFIAVNLYRGAKIKDDLGSFQENFNAEFPGEGTGNFDLSGGDVLEAGDDLEGIIVGIIIWIVASVIFFLAMWLMTVFLWGAILIFAGMLYWVFYNAVRIIFKHSKTCKNDILRSIGIGLGYSILYVSWIYGLLWIQMSYFS